MSRWAQGLLHAGNGHPAAHSAPKLGAQAGQLGLAGAWGAFPTLGGHRGLALDWGAAVGMRWAMPQPSYGGMETTPQRRQLIWMSL